MKPIGARMTQGMNLGSEVNAADNSGAKIVRITGVRGGKNRKGRQGSCGVGSLVAGHGLPTCS